MKHYKVNYSDLKLYKNITKSNKYMKLLDSNNYTLKIDSGNDYWYYTYIDNHLNSIDNKPSYIRHTKNETVIEYHYEGVLHNNNGPAIITIEKYDTTFSYMTFKYKHINEERMIDHIEFFKGEVDIPNSIVKAESAIIHMGDEEIYVSNLVISNTISGMVNEHRNKTGKSLVGMRLEDSDMVFSLWDGRMFDDSVSELLYRSHND